ncbi:MAG: hypothetical protein KAI47_17235, partial [Deltaproteobacteria bacterium]|nr:hypothetical protein [Deltaproteobacteria bacterium]
WSRWSISWEFHEDHRPDQASIVAWYVREYRAQAEAILEEKNPIRMLKTGDVARYKPVESGLPAEIIRREVEDLAFTLAQVVSNPAKGEIIKPAKAWTSQESFLRDIPAYETLKNFYALYAAIASQAENDSASKNDALGIAAHALFEMATSKLGAAPEDTLDREEKKVDREEKEGPETFTVFYSWQSDRPNKTNRGFIGDALKRAVRDLGKDVSSTSRLEWMRIPKVSPDRPISRTPSFRRSTKPMPS